MTSTSLIHRLTLFMAVAALLAGCATQGPAGEEDTKLTLFLVGDSTMADQPKEKYPEMGWGQALPEFLTDDIVVENHAKNGRSTKSFIDEGRWEAVMEKLQAGDFVVMGFGHNDQKDYDETRYAAPWGDYRANLEKMVDDVLARGARPILVTSIYRRAFADNGQPEATLGDYPEVTRAVASERRVPLVDLNVMTRQLLLDTGVEGSADIYMQIPAGEYANLPDGKDDNTHLQRRGAHRVAELFVQGARRQSLPLAEYFR